MNLRERILLGVLLGVLILGGVGGLFYYVLYLPYKELGDQGADEQRKLGEKQAELQKEEKERDRIVGQNPRLEYWKVLSLPEPAAKDEAAAAKGLTPDAVLKRVGPMRGAYQTYLQTLLLKSGFQGSTLQIVPQNPDTKSPVLQGKTTAYTKLPFSVSGQATWASVVEMLEKFHQEPLLHEVKMLRILRPATGRPTASADQPAGPGGPAPGAGGPQGPGRGQPADPRKELLDVRMTVEVLMVNGAEHRDELLPKLPKDALRVLAGGDRLYPDLVEKDMFHGRPTKSEEPQGHEDPAVVLEHVKLTMLAHNGRRWCATFYDQGAGGDERPVSQMSLPPELYFNDMYGNRVFEGKLAYIDAKQLVFQVVKIEPKKREQEIKGKYYRVRLGEMLSDALDKPLSDAELKELEIEKKAVATAEK